MQQQKKAYLFAGATVLLWSTVAPAFKIALREYDYIQVLFLSSIVSTITLFAILKLSKNLTFHSSISDLKKSALNGLLNPFGYYLILFKAYDLLPAQEAQCLNWTWPITLTIMSAIFLGQRLTIRSVVAIFICFFGVLVISTRGDIATLHFSEPLGSALAVGSSLLWATYWILNLKDKREPVKKLFYNFLFGSFYTTVLVILTNSFPQRSSQSFTAGIWIGLFEMSLAFLLWLQALNLADKSSTVGVFAYLTPFISLMFIFLILGEQIMISSVVGLVLIVGGILINRTKASH